MIAGLVVTEIPLPVRLDTLRVCQQRQLSTRDKPASSIPACLLASAMLASARAKRMTAGLGCPILISGRYFHFGCFADDCLSSKSLLAPQPHCHLLYAPGLTHNGGLTHNDS